ncbi:MFS transporter [Sphingomonas sp. MMS24-J13]|uniref:MFS transporter n=1 Tax=Sphingomonas sp. MMS24-J13 TaxID=3238686 RepID=UPI00384FB762
MASAPGPSFDVDAFLDSRRIGSLHIRVVIILALIMLVDGYDIFVVGSVLPAIADDWGIKPNLLAGVFIAQQAGLLTGVTVTGPFADRNGRKTTLLACLACFGISTFFVSFVRTPFELIALRFVSAIFFSGALPNCVAMVSEIAPKRMRAGLISVVFCGYTGASFILAWVLAFVLEPFGWRGAFILGGAMPLILLPIVWFFLPESIRFRAGRNPADPRIGGLLRQIDPSLRFRGDERFVLETKPRKEKTRPVTGLFRDGLLRITLLVWAGYLLAFLVNQLMSSWDTTIFHHVAKLSYKHIALLGACRTTAGVIGTATAGFVMDRFGATRSLSFFFLLASVLIGGIAFSDLGGTSGLILFTLTGYAMNSALGGLNAIAAITYPPQMRVTGVAWGSGIGRIGGMLGPVAGAFLLSGTPNTTTIYLLTAVPEALAGIAILAMIWVRRSAAARAATPAGAVEAIS